MATLVCFHAHPDDECIATGGVIAKAADEGHTVVVVFATRGEHGEVRDGFLQDGETLAERRTAECYASAAVLGAERVVFLGYTDSGMDGEPTNDLEDSFWSADVDEAAGRLAAVLGQVGCDVLSVYDDHGGYGHPDHVQVHRVGHRAARLAGVEQVYEATMNRDALARLRAAAVAAGDGAADDMPDLDAEATFGTPEALITTAVDVGPWLDRKRAAMAAHASQIADDHFMLTMAPEAFAAAFGTEWFLRAGQGPGITETDLPLAPRR